VIETEDPLPIDAVVASPPPSPRRSLVRLAVGALAVVLAAMATHTTDLLIVIVAIVIMIMLHELGHFVTAKWSHMKVTEYFLGFGPRLWSIRRGETEYGIKAIPAGGYVKIIGMTNTEEVDPADEARTYREQPFHNRLLVAVAGSAMHAIIAFVLIWALFFSVGTTASDGGKITAFAPLTHNIDPARDAGLRIGDVVVGVNGRTVGSTDQLINEITASAGRRVTVDVQRDGRPLSIAVTPQDVSSSKSVGRIGVELSSVNQPVSAVTAVRLAGSGFGHAVVVTGQALGRLFSPSGLTAYVHELTNKTAADRAAQSGDRIQSIYGAVRTADDATQAGIVPLVEVLIALNISLGMLNMLPMLPLDGGHVAIAVYERIRSRRGRKYHADVAKLMPVVYAFVLFLGFIVIGALYLDITHPVVVRFH
jgi:membrane-associated protease RseP (regulator of RpoE activity)